MAGITLFSLTFEFNIGNRMLQMWVKNSEMSLTENPCFRGPLNVEIPFLENNMLCIVLHDSQGFS